MASGSSGGGGGGGMLSRNHNASLSSPSCAKRQIIVQNDVLDGTPGNSNSSSSHGHGSLPAPVTPGSVGHDSGSSPHHSEPDNSGDSHRWRKISHQPQNWESSVIIMNNCILNYFFAFSSQFQLFSAGNFLREEFGTGHVKASSGEGQ
jgi:hypothetical protein